MFQFRALPFGLATSPFVFTRMMVAIAVHLRKRSIVLFPYLDDWLVRNQIRSDILKDQHFTVMLITSLGLIINEEKSELIPSQNFVFIGMEFLTDRNIVWVPWDRVRDTLVQGTEPCVSKDVSFSIREIECSCPVSYFGQTSFTPSTNGIICTMETAYSAIRTSHSDQYSDQESLRMVEQQRSFSSGCNTETTSSHSHSFHGREPFRLGCPSRTGGTSVS